MLFAPQVLSGIAIGIIWRWMYEPSDGPINRGLIAVGLPGWAKPWLGDFDVALPGGRRDRHVGDDGLLHGAVPRRRPEDPAEPVRRGAGRRRELVGRAAERHAPGRAQRARRRDHDHLIISLRIFDIVYVTTQGGPGEETNVPSLLIYLQAFQYGFVGSGAALAVVLGGIILVLSVVIHRFGERGR